MITTHGPLPSRRNASFVTLSMVLPTIGFMTKSNASFTMSFSLQGGFGFPQPTVAFKIAAVQCGITGVMVSASRIVLQRRFQFRNPLFLLQDRVQISLRIAVSLTQQLFQFRHMLLRMPGAMV